MKKVLESAAVIVLSILLMTGVKIQAAEGVSNYDIPSEAVEYNGHTYFLYDVSKNWDDAKSYCEKLGGHLITITSQEEEDYITELINQNSNKNFYWMGAKKVSDGSVQWITEETFIYNNWACGLDNKTLNYPVNQNVGFIYKYPHYNYKVGLWDLVGPDGEYDNKSYFGYENFGFICEWDIPKQYFNLSEDSMVIYEGYSSNIQYSIAPLQAVTFTSDNSNIVKVDSNGNVEGVSAGTAVITAAAADGQTKDCLVTVIKNITKIELNKKKVTLKVGSKYALKAEIYPVETAEYETISWNTNNKKIATVSNKGVVNAKKKGACTITVTTSSGKKTSCTIIVK
jgi:hypothetical protein